MDLDVAIVGAGVSGAYTAWRLQQALGGSDRLGLFEYSDRIGGRLFTVTLPGLPHVKAEVGGMRFMYGAHPVVTSLIEHLQLPTKPFPMGAPEPVGAQANLFYLRGKHLRMADLADPDKVPYRLAWPERGLGPTQLQVQVMNSLYPNFDKLTFTEQMRVHVFGQPVYKFGFWNLLFHCLSNEGFQFMRDAGGYECNVANANAVPQLPATEFSDETKFLTLRDGFDSLPRTLVKQFLDMPGITPQDRRLFLNQRLARIELGHGEFPYTLHFEPTVTVRHVTSAHTCEPGQPAREPLVVRAKKIVLAMPRRSLELIDSEFFRCTWLQENLDSVLIQSAFKLFLAYERPWWRALGLVAGRSVTDLPIRQLYYFGTECEQPGGEPWLNSLLMASYNDLGTVPFWKGLEHGRLYTGPRPSCADPAHDPNIPHALCARDQMVRAAHKQVEEVHGLPDIPMPYAAIYHSWNDDPFGGGWHEWKPGVRIDRVLWRMLKPDPHHDIHIVGEAYSYGQGWVEGALDTAEANLQHHFGLAAPAWLNLRGNDLMPCPPEGCGPLEDNTATPIAVTPTTGDLASITPNPLVPTIIQ